MSCPLCGAPLLHHADDAPPFCSATFRHTLKRRTDADLACRRHDFAILKAARELVAITRGVTDAGILPAGNALVGLALLRLLRTVDKADGPATLQRDLETLIKAGEAIREELTT